jgi:hypothetical protein
MATTYDPTKDPYSNFGATPGALGGNAVAVVLSDTVDFASYPKQIMAIATGNLVVLPLKAPDDGPHLITLTGVPAFYIVPFRVRRVMSTGTTASIAVAITD